MPPKPDAWLDILSRENILIHRKPGAVRAAPGFFCVPIVGFSVTQEFILRF